MAHVQLPDRSLWFLAGKETHTHTIHGKIGTVWLHFLCAKKLSLMENFVMILAQFCPTNYSELQGFFDYYQVVWLAKQTFTYTNGNPMVYNQSNDNLGFN